MRPRGRGGADDRQAAPRRGPQGFHLREERELAGGVWALRSLVTQVSKVKLRGSSVAGPAGPWDVPPASPRCPPRLWKFPWPGSAAAPFGNRCPCVQNRPWGHGYLAAPAGEDGEIDSTAPAAGPGADPSRAPLRESGGGGRTRSLSPGDCEAGSASATASPQPISFSSTLVPSAVTSF